ncbi:hypothetical protein HPB47_024537, partial [Ixodes persulcatus]
MPRQMQHVILKRGFTPKRSCERSDHTGCSRQMGSYRSAHLLSLLFRRSTGGESRAPPLD